MQRVTQEIVNDFHVGVLKMRGKIDMLYSKISDTYLFEY
jgi:hypothetical protein